MAEADDSASTRPQLVQAGLEDQAILANLLELYVHDFSEFHSIEIGPDGWFGYPNLPLYWSEPGRHPFLVKVGGSLAGFALIQKGSRLSGNDSTWDMAEFFVLRGYRRRGIGGTIARSIWSRFPGSWEVRVMRANRVAYHFWERAIIEFAGEPRRSAHVGQDGEIWDVFSFQS